MTFALITEAQLRGSAGGRQGTVHVAPAAMAAAFPAVTRDGDGMKVTREWMFRDATSGNLFTVYDYRLARDPARFWRRRRTVGLSLGGTTSDAESVLRFAVWLTARVTAEVTFEYTTSPHMPAVFSPDAPPCAAVPGVRGYEASADECVCARCDETLDQCGCERPLFQL